MAIEIRELIIKTVVVSERQDNQFKVQSDVLNDMRRELIEECKSLLSDRRKKNINKR